MIVLMVILSIAMALLRVPDDPRRPEIRVTATRAPRRDRARGGLPAGAPTPPAPGRLRNPWGRPRFLVALTWLYVDLGAACRSLIAMLFSFNNGRSRSVWQGFSIRWWWGDPSLSIFHDPDYTHALVHSLELAALDMLIATPLGVLLALGLARWRGRGSGVANGLMLVPLVTPEIVMAASLLLVFTQLALVPFTLVHLGTAGAGGRPGDVLAVLRGRDRPQPAGLDRPGVRGGRPRSRRDAARVACGWCCCRC